MWQIMSKCIPYISRPQQVCFDLSLYVRSLKLLLRYSVSVVMVVALRAPADLPVVPAGRGAGASCSSGCRVLDSDAGAADTPPDDPVLQPAQHATEQQKKQTT